jgi:D-2-hydroxyacid dehydrogenase (NADP+)
VSTVNVLLAQKLDESLQKMICEVDTRVKTFDVSNSLIAELNWIPEVNNSENERNALYKVLYNAEILILPRPPKILPEHGPKLSNLLSQALNLRWIHYVGSGLNYFDEMGLWDLGVIITNSAGFANISISEHILHFMLMFARKSLLCFANKQNKKWERIPLVELHGQTLGVLGLGNIGRETARLAKAFGMQVLAMKRSPVGQGYVDSYVDKFYPREYLHEMLAECDFVALTLPLTAETENIIGESELKAMKATAFLINIARGGLIDESVLITALKEGWIAGAGLDVFVKEPLPVESELWELPNTIITCHNSSVTGTGDIRMTEIFCDNLRKYLSGKPMNNIIEKEKGY